MSNSVVLGLGPLTNWLQSHIHQPLLIEHPSLWKGTHRQSPRLALLPRWNMHGNGSRRSNGKRGRAAQAGLEGVQAFSVLY